MGEKECEQAGDDRDIKSTKTKVDVDFQLEELIKLASSDSIQESVSRTIATAGKLAMCKISLI